MTRHQQHILYRCTNALYRHRCFICLPLFIGITIHLFQIETGHDESWRTHDALARLLQAHLYDLCRLPSHLEILSPRLAHMFSKLSLRFLSCENDEAPGLATVG